MEDREEPSNLRQTYSDFQISFHEEVFRPTLITFITCKIKIQSFFT